MSVTLTGQEGFFTRAGVFIGEYNRIAALYGSAQDAGFLSIWSQFASADQAAVQGLPDAVTAFRSSGASYQSTLVADGQQAMLLQVARTESLVPYSVAQALTLVRDQMVATAQSINRPTIGGSSAAGASNLGDTVIAVSTTNIYGDPLDMTLPEVFTITCTAEGNDYNATLQAVGQAAVSPTAYNWPQGSGVSRSLTTLDPAGSGGLLTDGGFANWSGTGTNTPTNWDILNGAAGTTIFRSVAGGVRTATDAAQITSDGASATQLTQDVSVSVNTVYAACFFAKINATTATGTFRIALTDGDGTVINNDAGTPLSAEYDLNGEIDTTYAIHTVFFSTPRQLPSTVRLQIGTSVAATAAREITFDLVGLVAATPLYGLAGSGTSGPFLTAFSGADPTAIDDTWTATFTNNITTQSFALGAERVYGLRNLGVYFPSDVSPTISDSLVTH